MAVSESREPARSRVAADSVLLIGTRGGGGIHHYLDEQAERLSDRVDVSTYDMYSAPGDGALHAVETFLHSLLAGLLFPVRQSPDVDVVHVHTSHGFSFYRASFYVLYAARVWQTPVLIHVHGSSFDAFVETDSRVVAAIQLFVFSHADRVIVLSAYWENALADVVDEDLLTVVPNAVDPDLYEPVYNANPLHVVFVSNLIPRKGVPELCEAIDRLVERADAPLEVTIGGKGPLESDVRSLAARHENVEYKGYLSETRKRELLSRGSVFVLPSHAENMPIAILEAMAGGTAVLSTTVGAIPEVVTEDGGILVDPGDVDGLVRGFTYLLESPARTAEMGRHNRRLVEEEYAWGGVVDRLLRIYHAEAEK